MHTGGAVSDNSLFNLSYTEDGVNFYTIAPITSISFNYDDDVEYMRETLKDIDKPVTIAISMTKRKYKRLMAILRGDYKPTYRKFKKGNRYVRDIY